MRNLLMVSLFVFGLLLKASIVAGAEAEVSGKADLKKADELRVSEMLAYHRGQPIYQPAPNAAAAASSSASSSASSNNDWVQEESLDNNQTTQVQPSQAIQNNNNITVGNPGSVNNSSAMGPNGPTQGAIVTGPVAAPGALAYGSSYDDASSVLGTRQHHRSYFERVSLIPMVGGSMYATRWNDHIGNSYTFGLAVDVPVSPLVSAEIEGGYARYNISYSYNPAYVYNHDFDQFLLGVNTKIYLIRGVFRPYIGGGLTGVYYDNMTHGPYYPGRYSQWIGMGQLLTGADISLSDDIAIGARGAWLIPMFNRPVTSDNGVYSQPYYEEAGAINTSFYKLMATLKVAL